MRIGVLGSLVWDVIYGRDPAESAGGGGVPPVEEWGGIAYALGGFEAALPADWRIVPLIKVGRDLRAQSASLVAGLTRLDPGTRCVEVPTPNNRVTLRYRSAERRTERMSGGVPGWTWAELGPMVRDLDALYINFISGFELELGTARALRQAFRGPIYADLHSLLWALPPDGVRTLRPLADAEAWFSCFDAVQMNEDEMAQIGPDPLTVAARALAAGVRLLVVTLGVRGAVYVAAPGFDGWSPGAGSHRNEPGSAVRTARIPAVAGEALDPTGCGDVFGAVLCAGLLEGRGVEGAMVRATALAGRNAGLRGATGLGPLLRGELAVAGAGA